MSTPPFKNTLAMLVDYATGNFPDVPSELSPVKYDSKIHISCGHLGSQEIAFFHFAVQIMQKTEKSQERLGKFASENVASVEHVGDMINFLQTLGSQAINSGSLALATTNEVLKILCPEVMYSACPDAFDYWGNILLTSDAQVCAFKKVNPVVGKQLLPQGHAGSRFFMTLRNILQGKIVFDSDPFLPPVPLGGKVIGVVESEMGRQIAILGHKIFRASKVFELADDQDDLMVVYRAMSYEDVYNNKKIITRFRDQSRALSYLLSDTLPQGAIPAIHGEVSFTICEGFRVVSFVVPR